MRNPPDIDYFRVPEGQAEIHIRLENWGNWVKPGFGTAICPMFRLARSNSRQWHTPELRATINLGDAILIEKHVAKLSPRNAAALRWCYVFRTGERHARKVLDTDRPGLFKLICDGRQKLTEIC